MTRLQKLLATALVVVGVLVVWQQTTMTYMSRELLVSVASSTTSPIRLRMMDEANFLKRVEKLEFVPTSDQLLLYMVTDDGDMYAPLKWLGLAFVYEDEGVGTERIVQEDIEPNARILLSSVMDMPTLDDFLVHISALRTLAPSFPYSVSVYRTTPWRIGAQVVGVGLLVLLFVTQVVRRLQERKLQRQAEKRTHDLLQLSLARTEAWDRRRQSRIESRRSAVDSIPTESHNAYPEVSVPTLSELSDRVSRLEGQSTALISRRPFLAAELAWPRNALVRDLKALKQVGKPKVSRILRLQEDADTFAHRLQELSRRYAA